jgi:hypothetical protein
MAIISRAQVKAYLGIVVPDYDSQIDLYIPIIDAKVKQICGTRFNYRVLISAETDSTTASLSSVDSYPLNQSIYEDLQEFVESGMQISGGGIPEDTYITEVYYNQPETDYQLGNNLPRVTLSNATTEAVEGYAYLGFNIAYLPLVAKAVWWMIDQQNTNAPTVGSGVASRTRGKVSVSFNEANSKIDGKYGVPSWLVVGLPKYHRGI